MRRKTRLRNSDGIYEPNMTPLIDVSLVLVVILMVATPMALQSGIAVSKASSSGRQAAPAKSDRIEITIPGGDMVSVNGAPVPLVALRGVLQPILEASATRIVVVRCADAVPHGTFVSVIDEAKALGATQVAVVGR